VESWEDLLGFAPLVVTALLIYRFWISRAGRQQHLLDTLRNDSTWGGVQTRAQIPRLLRRLAKQGTTAIDLRGRTLRDFSFPQNGFKSLKGSTFGWRDIDSPNWTELTNVDFSGVDCTGVAFSAYSPKTRILALDGTDLRFHGTTLRSARFDGARLTWTDAAAARTFNPRDPKINDPAYRGYRPAFWHADLHGCSFQRAEFTQADFRGARNLNWAKFHGAKGLETCLFDEGRREMVLAIARRD